MKDDVLAFFGRFGKIVEDSCPNGPGQPLSASIFHYNILYNTTEEAEKAIQNASKEEKSFMPRLSTTDIRV